VNILWIVAIVAALLQGGDAWSTYYGLYVRKPAFVEGNVNKWNLLLVGNKFALLTVKPVVTFGLCAAIAAVTRGMGLTWLVSGALPGIILGGAGAVLTVMNLKLLLK